MDQSYPKIAPSDSFEGNRIISFTTLPYPQGNLGLFLVHVSSDDMTKTLGTYRISHDYRIDQYQYNKHHWVDLNGDGLHDIIVGRMDNFTGEGQLVWYEHPQDSLGLDNNGWTEHLITSGPTEIKGIHQLDAYPEELIVWTT